MPKISIILPIYNVEQYLRQCLDSIVQQTLKDIEIICVDDCSTDDSLKILEEYEAKDNRFIIIKQKKNQGQGVARNIGIEHANGEYIGFVDPDDWIDATMYEKMYANAKGQDTDITICDFIRFFENLNKYGASDFLRKINERYRVTVIKKPQNEVLDKQFYMETILVLPMASWHKIYKKDLLKKYNIKFSHKRYLEDVKFNLYAFLYASNISYINENLYYYRVRQNSIMRQKVNLVPQAFEEFNEVYDILNNEHRFTEFEHNFKFFIIFTLRRICKTQNYVQKIKTYNMAKKYLDKHALSILKKDLDLQLLKHIFSVGNEKKGAKQYKVVRVLGIKIKFKNKNLVQEQKLEDLKKELKQCQNRISEQENLISCMQKKLENIQRNTLKLNQVPDITELAMLKTKYHWEDIKIPAIKNSYETIKELMNTNKSIIRFGDGDFKLIEENDMVFQKYQPYMAERMKEIIKCDDENLLIGIPEPYYDFSCDLNDYTKIFILKWFPKWHKIIEKYYNYDRTYYSTQISQMFPEYTIYDFENHYDNLKRIWNGKKITVITGDRVYNNIEYNIFENASEISYIYGPTENAFDKYEEIKAELMNVPKENILIFALGPAGKVLAYDMYQLGYRVLDLGHLIKDYDFYMKSSTMTKEEWNSARAVFFKKD